VWCRFVLAAALCGAANMPAAQSFDCAKAHACVCGQSRSRTRALTRSEALMNRVGHAFCKRHMREDNAIFGGEVTGHYYFRRS
jgi:hypothetical protein